MSSSSFASTSVFEGSSSSSTTTIGALDTPPIVRAFASSGNASSEIWPLSRNSSRNTSGAGESTFRNERTGSARAQSAATATPTATDSTISTVSEASNRLLQGLRGDQRHERAEEDDVRAPAHLGPDQAEQKLDPQQEQRRQHHQQHREADDVEAGRAAGGEELRVVLQEIEERLSYRERPEDGEVQVGPGGLLRAVTRFLAAHFGRA